MKINSRYIKLIVFPAVFLFGGWGNAGHETVNSNVFNYLPSEMNGFSDWESYWINHASDADDRKDVDPDESARHSINLDQYNEFLTHGYITQDLDSLIGLYSTKYVYSQGVLPWAILQCYDSLKNCLARLEWKNAKIVATDLAHYVADGHMPFHLKKDYDIYDELHDRFESDLIKEYADEIEFGNSAAEYINDVSKFVFNTLYGNYSYTDSIIVADSIAQSISYSNSGEGYYYELWNHSKSFTNHLFTNASCMVASLLYTAWVNAGKPEFNSTSVKEENSVVQDFKLMQNYPNPFNPATTISFYLPSRTIVSLKVFDVAGKEIATLAEKEFPAGNNSIQFDASRNGYKLTSGVYFYTLKSGSFSQTRKLVLLQ